MGSEASMNLNQLDKNQMTDVLRDFSSGSLESEYVEKILRFLEFNNKALESRLEFLWGADYTHSFYISFLLGCSLMSNQFSDIRFQNILLKLETTNCYAKQYSLMEPEIRQALASRGGI